MNHATGPRYQNRETRESRGDSEKSLFARDARDHDCRRDFRIEQSQSRFRAVIFYRRACGNGLAGLAGMEGGKS